MIYLQSPNEYFKYSGLFESYGLNGSNLWEKLNSMVLQDPTKMSVQLAAAAEAHEDFLFQNFETIAEMNAADAILRRNGYDPIFLTLENAYHETLSAVSQINEGLWDTVKGFLSTVTNGGSPLGVLQFVLDIIGVIPASLFGFPIDIMANFINCMIYFWNGEYMMGLINGIMAVPAFGQAIGGLLKGLLWPFKKIFGFLGKAIFGGSKTAIEAAAKLIKGTPGTEKAVAKLAPALKETSGFLAKSGAAILSKITAAIDWVIQKASLGTVSLPKSVIGWTDELVKKAGVLSKGMDDAAEALLKQEQKVVAKAADTAATASKAVGAEAEQAAKAAGKTSTEAGEIAAKEAERVAKKFDNIPGFSKQLQGEVIRSKGYQKLLSDGASDSVKNAFIRDGVNQRLVNSILKETKNTKSLVNALKNPDIIAALAKNKGLKVTDKVLVDAFSSGNVKQIKEVLDVIVSNPKLMKAISPRTAKAISVFRTVPEIFANGPRVFRSAAAALEKLPKLKIPKPPGGAAKWFGKEGADAVFTWHARRSGKYYLLFLLKMYLKQSDCAKYLIKGTPSEALGSVKNAAIDQASSLIPSVLESVKGLVASSQLLNEEDSSTEMGGLLSAADLQELQKISPEGHQAFTEQQAELDKSVKELAEKNSPKNPCSMDAAVAEAAAGGLISQTGIYQAKGGGDVYEIFDEESAAPLMNVVKSQLQAVNQDPNIDPQHPLSTYDPFTKAYFADIYDFYDDSYSPNVTGESRLDKTLDLMVKKGEMEETDREKVMEETITHWQNGTAPEAVLGQEAALPAELNEYLSFLKIGHVNVTPSKIS